MIPWSPLLGGRILPTSYIRKTRGHMVALGWVVAGVSGGVETSVSTVLDFLACVQIAGSCSPWKGEHMRDCVDQTINYQQQLALLRALPVPVSLGKTGLERRKPHFFRTVLPIFNYQLKQKHSVEKTPLERKLQVAVKVSSFPFEFQGLQPYNPMLAWKNIGLQKHPHEVRGTLVPGHRGGTCMVASSQVPKNQALTYFLWTLLALRNEYI